MWSLIVSHAFTEMAGTLSHLNERHYCRSAITAPEAKSPLIGKDSDAAKIDGR